MLSKEELLKPRRKIISLWPYEPERNLGMIIIEPDCPKSSQWTAKWKDWEELGKYPLLVKNLEWWEEREEKDLPEYVKFVRNYHHAKKGEIKKVLKYLGNGFYTGKTESYLLSDKDLLPATREEYEQFLSLINKTKMKNLIITGFSNPTSEGVTIHLNKPARLKTGTGHFEKFWISWDKIGAALFDGYTEILEVSERDKLRGKKPDA
jgi:hypothetical protein